MEDWRLAQQLSAEQAGNGLGCFAPRLAHDHALARSQTIRFDHDREMEEVDRLHGLLLAGGDRIGRGRDLVPLHKALGEGFAAFQLGRLLRGAKDRDAAPLQLVHQPQRQGKLRANHHQVRTFRRRDP